LKANLAVLYDYKCHWIKRPLFLCLIACLITASCANNPDGKSETDSTINYFPEVEYVVDLSAEQQAAFDALDSLQVQSADKHKLYSTFPGIIQPCYPADTNYTISQEELLFAMKEFVSRHYQNLSPEMRKSLAENSVKAQKEYTVLHCHYRAYTQEDKNSLPLFGTWVIPSILGHRDLLLNW